ncbi:MAG: ATP-binding protein [Anaerolineae bacterium]|jgi:hypothetical protein|nr:ATP-binding protein [Anaerolineae bacterium]
MTNCSRIPDALPSPHESYDAKHFVGRDQEIKKINNLIEAGRQNAPILRPIIHVWGPPGIGKSWLLFHLEHKWNCHPDSQAGSTPIQGDVFVTRIELSDLKTVIETLAKRLCSVSSDPGSNPKAVSLGGLHSQTQQCVARAKAIAAGSILIFLFDGAEKLPTDDFLRLEEEFISPLVCTERVIFIVASRKELTLWQEFEVRRRLEIWELQAFDRETTRKQLARYRDASRVLDEIYSYTKGLPHANQLFAAALEEGCLSDERKPAYLSQVEAELLQDIAENEWEILRVLSTLRKFNVESTRCILGEFIKDRGFSAISDGECRSLLANLEQSRFVIWDKRQLGYIISPTARKILQSRLWTAKPDRHTRLHRYAQTMIEERLKRYQGEEVRLFPEMLYHCVQQHHNDEPALGTDLDELVKIWLTPTHITAVELDELLNVLEEDRELGTDLGANLYQQLIVQIENLKDLQLKEMLQ